MPYRCYCAQQRQGGGIHRRAAETVLHSRGPPCPTGLSFSSRKPEESRSETQGLYPISCNRLLNFSRGLATCPGLLRTANCASKSIIEWCRSDKSRTARLFPTLPMSMRELQGSSRGPGVLYADEVKRFSKERPSSRISMRIQRHLGQTANTSQEGGPP